MPIDDSEVSMIEFFGPIAFLGRPTSDDRTVRALRFHGHGPWPLLLYRPEPDGLVRIGDVKQVEVDKDGAVWGWARLGLLAGELFGGRIPDTLPVGIDLDRTEADEAGALTGRLKAITVYALYGVPAAWPDARLERVQS